MIIDSLTFDNIKIHSEKFNWLLKAIIDYMRVLYSKYELR